MKQLIIILSCLYVLPVWAQSSMVFKREVIKIIPQESNETQQEDKESKTPPRAPISFYSDFRSQQVLEMDWVMSLSRISEKRTMTILFDPPRYDAIYPQPLHQPLDILLVNPHGTIVQIMPELVLSNLSQAVESSEPIRARIILKGGAVEALGIIPGDRVDHPAVAPAPKVLK